MLSRRILLIGLLGWLLAPGLLRGEASSTSKFTAAANGTNSLTFFVASDLHYGWPLPGSNVLQRKLVAELNSLPGKTYPSNMSGVVGIPRGVLLLGDLIQDAKNNSLANWSKDWGYAGEGLIRYPVYEGLGNHDVRDRSSWAQLKKRNATRQGLEGVSTNGFHYSWDWNGIHFVMLNISPAVNGGLEFLREDLNVEIGKTGRPIILLQHYPVTPFKSWTKPQIDEFYEVVKSYNVVCIMHGHTHATKTYKWRGIDVLDDGSLKRNNPKQIPPGFVVARVEGNTFTAVIRTIDGKWGKVLLQKQFALGAEALARN